VRGGVRRIAPVAVPLLLLACRGGPSGLAVVGGRVVTAEEVRSYVATQAGRPAAEVAPELAAALFERYLEEAVILAASPEPSDRDLPPPARSARARDLLPTLCPPPRPPSDAEVDAYLAAHPAPTPAGDRIRLRQLILPDPSSARRARERLRAGEDFAALSREASRAPNAADGGLIGWVERGQLPPEFEAAVFGLAAGEASEPVASNAGWHVFQVMERRAAGGAATSDARQRARGELEAERAEASHRECLAGLAARAGVSVDCVGAFFPCHNPYEGKP